MRASVETVMFAKKEDWNPSCVSLFVFVEFAGVKSRGTGPERSH